MEYWKANVRVFITTASRDELLLLLLLLLVMLHFSS